MQTNELSGTITDVGRVRTGLASLLFAAIAVLMVADMASDAGTGANRLHLMGEALVMVAAFAGVGLLWRGWRALGPRLGAGSGRAPDRGIGRLSCFDDRNRPGVWR